MSINCPKCNESILPWKLKQHCLCPHCKTPLKAKNINTVFIVTLIAWSLAEIAIKNFMWSQFGDSGLSLVFSMAISAAVGFSIYFILVRLFSSAEIAPIDTPQP